MHILKMRLRHFWIIAIGISIILPETNYGEGWRFWKRKPATEAEIVENEDRDAQKKQAKEEKKKREEVARTLKKKERELSRKQKEVKREYEKMQRKHRRRLRDLSRQSQGKRTWKFWRKSEKSSDFFLPKG